MSLLRLLTTGKSWTGTQDANSRYRMRRHLALPKFGSAKNPFAPPPPNSESPSGSGKSSAAKLETGSLFEPAAEKPAPREIPKPAPAKETKAPARPPAPPAATTPPKAAARLATDPAPAIPARKPARWSAWMGKLNPLSLLPPLRGDRGRGRPARKAVQTELTLEKVRVVRNDLSDTGLEIVPGRLMGIPSGASPILPHPANPQPGAWGRLTSKFLGTQHAEMR